VFDVSRLTGVAVCQYLTHGTDQPGLLASRLLTGPPADAELAAPQAAPTGGGPANPQDCIPDGWGDSAVVLRLTSGGQTQEMYGYYEWCFGNGFDDGFDDGTAVRAHHGRLRVDLGRPGPAPQRQLRAVRALPADGHLLTARVRVGRRRDPRSTGDPIA
jgi:hypothetical protein